MMLLVTPSISPSLSLSAILSFISCLFWTWALSGRRADLIREWAAWIGGICVTSMLALRWPNAFLGNPSYSAVRPDQLNVRPWTTWRSEPFEDFLSFLETLPPAGFMPAGCLPSSGLREVRIHAVSDQLCQSPQVTDPSNEHQPSTSEKTVRGHEQRQLPCLLLVGSVLGNFNTWFYCLGQTRVQFYHFFSAFFPFFCIVKILLLVTNQLQWLKTLDS